MFAAGSLHFSCNFVALMFHFYCIFIACLLHVRCIFCCVSDSVQLCLSYVMNLHVLFNVCLCMLVTRMFLFVTSLLHKFALILYFVTFVLHFRSMFFQLCCIFNVCLLYVCCMFAACLLYPDPYPMNVYYMCIVFYYTFAHCFACLFRLRFIRVVCCIIKVQALLIPRQQN